MRNCDVNWDRGAHAESVKGRLDFRAIADHKHSKLVWVNVLFGDGGEIGERNFLEGRAVGFEIIGRIAVEFEFLALIEDLVPGVVAEEERVENIVFRALEPHRQ